MPLGTFVPKTGELELKLIVRHATSAERTESVQFLVAQAQQYPEGSDQRRALMDAAISIAEAAK